MRKSSKLAKQPKQGGRASEKKPATREVRPATREVRKDTVPRGASTRTGIRRSRRLMKTAELIARDIILDISERGLKAGDSLPPEATMIKHYEVGRASLREALRLLEVQGLVQIRAGAKGGPAVGAATAENLGPMLSLHFGLAGATYQDLAEVMVIFYQATAELAAARSLTRAEVRALELSIEGACSAHYSERTEALKDFHRVVTAASKNSIWTLIADAVGLIFADHVMSTADSRGFQQTASVDHEEIAKAILARDPAAAGKAMREHTERMIEFYRKQMPALFSQLVEWR